MTVALASDVEVVRSGNRADAGELVNNVLRSVREQQHPQFDITPELEAWLLEAAAQPATPLTQADFDGIRNRARARVKSSPQ